MSKQLPRGWKEFALKDIGNFLRGSGISKKDLSDTGIPAIRYGDIYTKYDFVIKNVSSFTNSKGTELKKGDILFAGSGETAEEIGKSVAFIDDYKAFAGGDIIIFRPNIDLNSLFLSYILNSGKCRKDISIMGQGHTVVHIYASSLEILKVILPPLDEQKRIADILSTFDDLIENLTKLIEKKEIYKKGVMQRVLSGEVRFNGFTDKWETVSISELVDKNIIYIEKGKAISKDKIIEGDIPVIAGGKTPAYYHNECTHDFPCITISASGTAGYVWFHNYKIWASDCNILYTDNKNYNVKFLYYYLLNIQKIIYGLKTGGVQPHVYAKDIINLTIPNISIEEQNKIAELLTLIDQDIDNLKRPRH